MRFHVIWRKSHEPEEAYRDFCLLYTSPSPRDS